MVLASSLRILRASMLALGIAGAVAALAARQAADLPARLSDEGFWQLIEQLSEPESGSPADNLVSNELVFGRFVPDLVTRGRTGGVYIGVGPEQNFTYIAAVRPRIAFITDNRRQNLHLQLMYKAIIELSADRVDFISRLFTKSRQPGLTASSTADQIFQAYWSIHSLDETAYASNLAAIRDRLRKDHNLQLSDDDLAGIARVYRAFYWYGPSIDMGASTTLTSPFPRGFAPSFRDQLTQMDASRTELSFLASETAFAVVKFLHTRNLIVPVVGDLSGPKALRAIGAYIRDRGATVDTFYVSNVESRLNRTGTWPTFCANVATFPLTNASVFIRPSANGALGSIGPIANEVKSCAR